MSAEPTESSFRDRIRKAKVALGSFVFSSDPAVTEIIGLAGFDFVIIDTEHTTLTLKDVGAHIYAAKACGISAIVRLGANQVSQVGPILNSGAEGLLLPHVGLGTNDAAKAARYHPAGTRGTCSGVRSADYGLANFADRVRQANRDVVVIGAVEDAEVVDRIDDVLAEGLFDAIVPGPGDLATSLGVPGQQTHPTVLRAVDRIVAAARADPDRLVGGYVLDPAAAPRWLELGVNFLVYSLDYRVLSRAFKHGCEELRNTVKEFPTISAT